MKKFILFVLSFLCLFSTNAQLLSFSDSARVSLITCSPGSNAVYERFGHTAIRIYDPLNNIDIVFNYGIFDFNTDNFILKFIKGETDYKLAVYDFRYFLPEYIVRNSWVWEQVLNLTDKERQKLIELLLINYEPENRTYRYNFAFDNCATRPRDIIKQALNGYLNYTLDSEQKTFREWVGVYVGTDTWLKLGIDMVFGNSADVVATRVESMFLPEVLMNEFQATKIVPNKNTNEEIRPLVSRFHVLVEHEGENTKKPFLLFTPIVVSILLLLAGIAFLFKRRKFCTVYKIFDTLIFTVFGLIGVIIFYLDYFSLHPLVNDNVNILWLNPLLFFVGFMQWIKPWRFATFILAIVVKLCTITALILYLFGISYFNIVYIPLILLILIRIGNYIRRRLKKGVRIGSKELKVKF